jgi:hypothetical protein
MEDLYVFDRALTDDDVRSLTVACVPRILATPPTNRTPAEIELVYDWWLAKNNAHYASVLQQAKELARQQSEIKVRGVETLVMHEKPQPPTAFVLKRGEYDQRQDQVGPDTPAMLPAFPANLPRNRLGFARWLMMPEHPLTARVAVNRFWSEVFGVGLVKTAGDFGVQGQMPSHPELLDWLAVEFRESGWDVKHLFRLMVTSATYRQSGTATTESIERDPENRFLSHGPRFRMDAEMIRDYALSASGLLSPKIGGRSVRPYQPRGVWEAVAMLQSNTGTYEQDVGDAVYRRSLYTLWKRAAPPASMEIFNAPAREACTIIRERTNTPLQALVTMNGTQFVEASRRLAERAIEEKSTDTERIQFLAERVLARQLDATELAISQESLHRFETFYSKSKDEAANLVSVGNAPVNASLPNPKVAAWTMLASQFLNLDEALNK